MAVTGKRGGRSARGKPTAAAKNKPGRPPKVTKEVPEEKGSDDVPINEDVIEKRQEKTPGEVETGDLPNTGDGVPTETMPNDDTDRNGGAGVENGKRQADSGVEEPLNDIGDLDRGIEEELGEARKSVSGDDDDDFSYSGDVWTPKKEDKLIDMYEKCRFLYDKDHKDYLLRNKNQRANAVFADKLGVTAKEVKKRLKHLRNTFGRIKKKQEKSGSGVIRMTPRKAHIVTRLEFLRSHTVTRPTTSTFTANKTGLYTDSEGSEHPDSSDAGTPEKLRSSGCLENPPKDKSTNGMTVTLPESPTMSSSLASGSGVMLPPSTPKRKRAAGGGGGKSPKTPRKSPLLALEESLTSEPKKGTNTKNKRAAGKRVSATATANSEEERQTRALEDMVRVVKGAVNVPKTPPPPPKITPRERWLHVTGDRMGRMERQIEEEFMHEVDLLSYDAIRKRGKFTPTGVNQLAVSQGSGPVTYVIANPNNNTQYQALPTPRKEAQVNAPSNATFQYTQDILQQQASGQKPPNVPNATMPPPVGQFHTSPNKMTGSPANYLIMGAPGGYYQQQQQQ